MSSIFTVYLIAAAGLQSASSAHRQVARVDLIELNHFVDEEGREVFRQLIFYDWSDQQNRFLVRSWRLIKSADHLPKRSWNPRGYFASWRENGSIRRVEASQFRETWTQKDPEKQNRRWLPEDQRKALWPETPASR
ncbi:hypothetical protein [Crateriforma conspicua]|uniref:Uncharacterized protein n=1 Tax=Crateriforma conspicua TaxID=2527996 RepID=A0A5C5Y6B7_9PLAN|nr:hypothetical protein [Crateriforma conspicua]QDV65836.1 hypothetical protein Mal65_50090 [Crateriforma conspicua]TWT71236.1 hypothetical protein Pan14r_35460 [Crateriforma conspicua]